jgi:uncharacterized protein YbjT (DUF2867 family)
MDNSQKVATIGGTGKGGRRITAHLLQKGYQVRSLEK